MNNNFKKKITHAQQIDESDNDDESESAKSLIEEEDEQDDNSTKNFSNDQPKTSSKTPKVSFQEYLRLEQKSREERFAKRLIPDDILSKEDKEKKWRQKFRLDRRNAKLILHGRPKKKPESKSPFSDADFEAVKKNRGKSSGLNARVKRIK